MFACLYSLSTPLAALVSLAESFTPRFDVRGPLVMLDVSGLSRLLGSFQEIGEQLRRSSPGPVRIAIAPTQTAAALLALGRAGLTVVASGEQAAALAPLQVSVLGELDCLRVGPEPDRATRHPRDAQAPPPATASVAPRAGTSQPPQVGDMWDALPYFESSLERTSELVVKTHCGGGWTHPRQAHAAHQTRPPRRPVTAMRDTEHPPPLAQHVRASFGETGPPPLAQPYGRASARRVRFRSRNTYSELRRSRAEAFGEGGRDLRRAWPHGDRDDGGVATDQPEVGAVDVAGARSVANAAALGDQDARGAGRFAVGRGLRTARRARRRLAAAGARRRHEPAGAVGAGRTVRSQRSSSNGRLKGSSRCRSCWAGCSSRCRPGSSAPIAARRLLHTHLRLVSKTVHARTLQLPAPMRDPKTLRTLVLLDLESNPPSARRSTRCDSSSSRRRRACAVDALRACAAVARADLDAARASDRADGREPCRLAAAGRLLEAGAVHDDSVRDPPGGARCHFVPDGHRTQHYRTQHYAHSALPHSALPHSAPHEAPGTRDRTRNREQGTRHQVPWAPRCAASACRFRCECRCRKAARSESAPIVAV